MHDVVIIGGGPSGLTAAIYASRSRLDTLLVEKMFSGGQMATAYTMENFPGFEEPVAGTELAKRMENQALKFGTEIVRSTVKELQLDQVIKTIKTNDNIYRSKTVILSMGARPRELGLPNEKKFRGSGVSYCATCDGAFFSDKKVAVVGGGDTAVEDAAYLTRYCSKVYLIHRRDNLRATKVLQENLMNNKKVEFIWSSVVEKINGEFGVENIIVKNVNSSQTRKIDVDGLFIAIGVLPNSKLAEDKIELNNQGYIVTDNNMQTNIFGVFAAGDIREKPLRQVVTAASDGAVAAFMAKRYIDENKW